MTKMKDILKAAGEAVSFVYKCRNYTSNNLIRRILKFIATPFGLAKYFITSESKSKREGLALVLIAKNEAPYLEEWVNFHVKQGVSHFFIYDNDSTDNTYGVLKKFIDLGILTYRKIQGMRRQHDAYNLAVSDYGHKFKYMAMIDADEFLFVCNMRVREGISLYDFMDEFMNAHPDAGGLGVNWLLFGSSGHVAKPKGGILKNYTMCAEKEHGINFHIKTICDPLRVLAWSNPHFPIYRRGFRNLDITGEAIAGAFTREVHHDTIRINHYYTRSKEEYTEKIKRGLADREKNIRNMEAFYYHDKNDVINTDILRNI